jgi:hypothetical protein
MTAKLDARRREVARLRRQIAYYCGVIARTESRTRIQWAHAVIRQREWQLLAAQSDTRRGGSDE